MKLFKRTAEPAEDPYVTARLGEIAARCKTEASLYQAVKKAQGSYGASRPKKRFKKA